MKTSTVLLGVALVGATVAFAAPLPNTNAEDQKYAVYLESSGLDPSAFMTLQGVEVAPSVSLPPASLPDTPQTIVEATSARLRLRDYLYSVSSPYADVDVIGACDAAGISRHQCRLLLAICGQESNNGKVYRRASTHRLDNAAGVEFHNCAGVKGASWHEKPYSVAGFDFYLAKFDSWDEWWTLFAAGQKKARFSKGCDTAPCFAASGWLNGDRSGWIRGVRHFYAEIPDLTEA